MKNVIVQSGFQAVVYRLFVLVLICSVKLMAAPVFKPLAHFGPNGDAAAPFTNPILDGKDGFLYGLTSGGQLFSIQTNGEGYRMLHQFPPASQAGIVPYSGSGSLAMDSAGYLYGATRGGGEFGLGMVFRASRNGEDVKSLLDFGPFTAGFARPKGVILGSDGMLYGAVAIGDAATPNGGVFRMSRSGEGFTILGGVSAEIPVGVTGLSVPVEGPDGSFYGVLGGSSVYGGAIYRVRSDSAGFSLIHVFGNVSNSPRLPVESLIYASDGMLYGMFGEGLAPSESGGVFRIQPTGLGFTAVKYFNESGFKIPSYGLTEGGDGLLYGVLQRGGQGFGGVFRMGKSGAGFQIIHVMALKSGSNEHEILSRPVIAGDKIVVGSGSSRFSQISTMNLDGSGYVTPFYSGEGGPGPLKPAMVARSADGTLFTFNETSPRDEGVLSRIDAGTTSPIFLKSFPQFNSSVPGSYTYPPDQGLLDGRDGWMYTATWGGGINGTGAVSRVNKTGVWEQLHSFGPRSGDTNPVQVSMGPNARLYGVTSVRNSSSNGGSIYSINRDGTGFTTLMRFNSFTNQGRGPSGSLTVASDGLLYGATYYGGLNDSGVIYRISSDGTNFGVIHHFSGGAGGANPLYAITEGPDGFLYGVTRAGGARNQGVIYKLSKSGANFAILRSFLTASGELIMAASPVFHLSNGSLCGLAAQAVSRNNGGIFCIQPDGTDYRVVHRFLTQDSGMGNTYLTQGDDAILYGTASLGGLYGYGMVFSYGEELKPELRVYNGSGETFPELNNDGSAPVEFGVTGVSVPVSRYIYLKNSGTGVLQISGISLPQGYSFASSHAMPFTLTPAAGASIVLRLDALVEGVSAGNIIIESNDAQKSSFAFPVSGASVTPEITLLNTDAGGAEILNNQVTALSFGRNIQNTPGRRRLILKNTGSAPLLISGFDITAGYQIEELHNVPFSLPSGASQEFSIALVEKAPGQHLGKVSIATDDLDESVFAFSLVGEVFIPAPGVAFQGNSSAILNRQTGLREHTVRLSNLTSAVIPSCRLIVRGLPPGVEMNNASELREDGSWVVYIGKTMKEHTTLDVLLEYYSTGRAPIDSAPEVSTEVVLEPMDLGADGNGGFVVERILRQPDGSMFLDFKTAPGRVYQVEYSSDGRLWQKSLPQVRAAANRTLWIDRGLPRTETHPVTESSRMYRIREIIRNEDTTGN